MDSDALVREAARRLIGFLDHKPALVAKMDAETPRPTLEDLLRDLRRALAMRNYSPGILDPMPEIEKVRIDFSDLNFAVQYTRQDGGYGRWLTMAAYDVDTVAVRYAHECQDGGTRPWKYRAVEIEQ